MKKYYSFFVAAVFALSTVFISCGNDTEEPEDPHIPELEVSTDNILVQADGSFNLQITSGGGEFRAFSLNDDIATVRVSGNTVTVEGVTNGQTALVVSDHNGLFKRVPVVVYTTNQVVLEHTHLTLVTRTGWGSRPADNPTTTIVSSNGGLESMPNAGFLIDIDRPSLPNAALNVTIVNVVGVDDNGDETITPTITVSGTSALVPFTAYVTITDISGFSQVLEVTVEPTMVPYNATEMALVAFNGTARRFFLSNGGNGATAAGAPNVAAGTLWGTQINGGFTNFSINGIDNGQLMFGYDSNFGPYDGSMFQFRLWWTGDTSVGVKEGGRVMHNRGNNAPWQNFGFPGVNGDRDYPDPVPAYVEVVRNDGDRIWVIWSAVVRGQLRWGYFVDFI